MPQRFRLSFTAASLFVSDMALLAGVLQDLDGDWSQLDANVLKRNRHNSSQREFKELILRLKTLSREELDVLAEGSLDDQKQVSIIAFGRSYSFFRQFVKDVVLRKLEVFNYQLADHDYWSFYSSIELTHPELSEIAESTRGKLRQVVFKVMEQGGLIDSVESKRITPPILTSNVRALVAANGGKDAELLLDQTMRMTL